MSTQDGLIAIYTDFEYLEVFLVYKILRELESLARMLAWVWICHLPRNRTCTCWHKLYFNKPKSSLTC